MQGASKRYDKKNGIKYNKCDVCGRVFNCNTRDKLNQWNDHRFRCNLSVSVSDETKNKKYVEINVHVCGKKGSTAYIIDNEFTEYQSLAESVSRNLQNCDLCVIDHFVFREVAEGVLFEFQQWYASGVFKEEVFDKNEYFNPYFTHWLMNYKSSITYLKTLKHSIHSLITSLKLQKKGSAKPSTHFKLSFYPKYSGFDVQIDNPNDNECLFSVVYFCNKDYERTKDKGVHRLFLYDKQSV